MTNEIRHDHFLGRHVIVASERSKRPTDFLVQPAAETEKVCPFCSGNEETTPRADLILTKREGRVIISADGRGGRARDWDVRCFSNLYPALSPSPQKVVGKGSLNPLKSAYGYHEIIVESPRHHDHLGKASQEQTQLALKATLVLLQRFYDDKKIRYVGLFCNHRKEAGASQTHPHSQMIATPFVPPKIRSELAASKHYFQAKKRCLLCDIIEKETSSSRKVFENDRFLVFSPWASISPFEFWVAPKRHTSHLERLTEREEIDLADALWVNFGALARLLHDPPYNYGFHTSPNGEESNFYHWHLEVYPKLAVLGGFELSTGAYINFMSPEVAAGVLRQEATNL